MRDDLRAARGICHGLMLGLIFWAIVIAAAIAI